MRRILLLVLLVGFVGPVIAARDPVRFAVIGDMGCGCRAQEAIAEEMLEWYQKNPFQFVLTTGDNIYGNDLNRFWGRSRGGDKRVFTEQFDRYYNPLRNRGVPFFATLGNHDLQTRDGRDVIEDRRRFNILSKEGYYYFSPDPDLVTFVALNTEALLYKHEPTAQVEWLQKVLSESKSRWKIVYGHHPLYSPSGSHSTDPALIKFLEPVLVRNGVKVYFAGHNHFYSRSKPQHGIIHFTTGGGGRHLKTPIRTPETDVMAKAHHFMHVNVYEDRLEFWAIPIRGPLIDKGSLHIGPRE